MAPTPRLHPNLAIVYRKKIASLTQALMANGGAAAMKLVRGLVEEIRLVPEGGATRIELRGELAAIIGLAGSPNSQSPGVSVGALAEQVKMVAGTGFEPVTFRL